MFDTATMIWGVVFGSVGLGFFIYGTRQKAIVPLLSGIGLMSIPYFVSNIYLLLISCLILLVLPYFVRI